jgi:F-type H+-transporting ATPase subunit b
MHATSILLASAAAPVVDVDGTIFIQAGIFLLLMAILYPLLFKPWLATRARREEAITGTAAAATDLRARAEELGREYDSRLAETRAQRRQRARGAAPAPPRRGGDGADDPRRAGRRPRPRHRHQAAREGRMTTVHKRIQTVFATAVVALYSAAAVAASPAAGPAGSHDASPAHGEAAHHGITWLNWPNSQDHRIGLAYLLINFLVLAFLLHRLLIRKLVADNAARHDAIAAQVEAARKAMNDAESVIADYKGRIDRLDRETREILDQARAGAEADRARLFTDAKAEVERFKAQALAMTQREVQLTKQKVEAEVLDRAVQRAEEILRQRFTDADQSRLVDDYAIDVVSGRATA